MALTAPHIPAAADRTGRSPARALLALVACLATAACGDGTTVPTAATPVPNFLVLDGAHNGGNEHVYLLPPLVASPSPTGTFDPTLTPRVEICATDLTQCTGPVIASFAFGPSDSDVRLVAEEELYQVEWHTGASAVAPGEQYRIRILQANYLLAFADVEITSDGGRNPRTGEVFALSDGRTLPIKVRIEEGAVFVGGSADGGASVVVPPTAVGEPIEVTVTPVDAEDPPEPLPPPSNGTALPGTIYNFEPSGQQFSEPVEITLAIPPSLPQGVDPTRLGVYYAGPDGWEQIPTVVDLATGQLTALTTHFSSFAILPGGVTACDGSGYATIEDALTAVAPGGTVTVCGAGSPYSVQNVQLLKPLTLEGEAGYRPILASGTARFALMIQQGGAPGTVVIQSLRVETDVDGSFGTFSGGILVESGHDQVLLTDLEVAVSTNQGAAIVVNQTSGQAGANTTVDDVDVVGGRYGLIAITTSLRATLDILNSAFAGAAVAGVRFAFGATGRVEGNTFSGCAQACLWMSTPTSDQPAPPRVIGNTILGGALGSARFGIDLQPGPLPYELRDNQVLGSVGGGDRSDPNSYAFRDAGIRVRDANAAGTVEGNTVSGSFVGLQVSGGSAPVTGLDHTISGVYQVVEVPWPGGLTLQSSDFLDYLATGGQNGDLTCNYWGDPGGPEAYLGIDVLDDPHFTPWATSAVAGTSTTTCAGGL